MGTRIELPPGEVHVWVASLDLPERDLATLSATLSDGECGRAARLRFARDRRRFVVRRGLRRAILGAYLGRAPAAVRFAEGGSGKPALAGADVAFSCSHSRDVALVAVSRGRRLGIDVERLRPVASAEAIAGSLFAPAEHAALGALPPRERDAAFLRCWTRKEAYLKAGGEGLGGALDGFSVSLAPPTDPPTIEAVRGGLGAWSLQALAPAPGYVAALAAERPPWQVRCRRW